MKRITLYLLVFFLTGSLFAQESTPKAKNIILLIGDGMGVAQVFAAQTLTKDNLVMTTLPYTAFVLTQSADDYITDSAAGGTALATGKRTNNGMVGVLPDGTPVKSILKYASENGLKTGLVSTSSITHATPASFIANVAKRSDDSGIAADFLKADIDVFIGGGAKHFEKHFTRFREKGYQIVTDREKLQGITDGKLAGLVYSGHGPTMTEGRGTFLPDATAKAIDLLNKGDKGFFLMVEGSQIDWGGHANSSEYAISETVDFDQAVGKALDFARKDGNTLVIVTADHETGGMTITGGSIKEGDVKVKFSRMDHTPVPVPLFAFGPGAETFHGVIKNTDVFNLMMKAYQFPVDCPKP